VATPRLENSLAHEARRILYTAKTHTTGGRDGRSISDDKLLDVKLALPKSMGGAWTKPPRKIWWRPRNQVCPYSNATRNNIEVDLSIVT